MYTNMCYDPAHQKFMYITEEDSESSLSVSAGPLGNPWGTYQLSIDTMSEQVWRKVTQSRRVEHLNGVYVIYFSWNAENFGHFVLDELFPIFRALELFGLEASQPLLVRIKASDPNKFEWTCDWMEFKHMTGWASKCKTNYERLTKLLTSREPVVLNSTFRSNKIFCFSRIVSGLGLLSDHCEDETRHGRLFIPGFRCNIGVGASVWKFRDHALRQLNVGACIPNELRIVVDCTLSRKRTYPQLSEGVQRLSQYYNESRPDVVVVGAKLAEMSLKQQLEIISCAAVFISGAGGGAAGATVFLPRWASAFIAIGSDRRHYDIDFISRIGYVRVKYIPLFGTLDVKQIDDALTSFIDLTK